jgi:hypothetical protein
MQNARSQFWGYLWVALTSTACLMIFGSRMASADEQESVNREAHLARVRHLQNILPDRENAGFGSLLYDSKGQLALHGRQKTWLYTSALSEAAIDGQRDWYGKWISYAREFDIESHVVGAKRVALGLTGEDHWAVIHDVLQASEHMFVAFYSANGAVRAAVATAPQGPFVAVASFRIAVTDDWEKVGGKISSLESNGAHVLIDDTADKLTIWLGYDSYHVDATAGQLAWAKVEIDKQRHSIILLGKHPDNPLPTRPANYIAARCGGNLSTNVRLGGQRALFYYSRPTTKSIMLTLALSDDPLFLHVSKLIEFEPPLLDEQVIEKFESYVLGDELHLIYENKLANGHWGTGMRVYKILP